MKIKHLLLVPGAIALTLSCLPVFPASAQTQPAPATKPHKGFKDGFKDLNLTEDQKTQIQRIRQKTKADVQQYLQSQGITIPQGQQRRDAMRSLTAEQKQRLREIHQAAEQQIQGLLTNDQRTLLEQRRAQMKQRFQQGRPTPSVQPQ